MTRGRSPGLRLPWSQVNGEKVSPLTVEYTFAHSRIEYIFLLDNIEFVQRFLTDREASQEHLIAER